MNVYDLMSHSPAIRKQQILLQEYKSKEQSQQSRQTQRKKKAINKTHNIHIRLTNHQYRVLRALSRQNDISMTQVITDYLDTFELVKKQNTTSET